MCEPAKVKRRRSSVFSHLEKNSVTELVVKYNSMLGNKNPSKKNEAWSQIVEEFNRKPHHTKRTYEQIKKFYQNNKSEINKKINCANREEVTGGASPLYIIKNSTTYRETTDSSYTNDIDDDFIKFNEPTDDLSELQMVQLEDYLASELGEWGRAIVTSTTVQDDTIPCKSQHPDDIEKEGDVSDPQTDIETITDASQTESVCNQQGKERKEREVQCVNKRKSGDSKDWLFKENSEDSAKWPSAVLIKQPEEECQIYTFFKSIAMSVKKMDLEYQIRARRQILEIICQLELVKYRSSSSSDFVHSYLVSHDHLQQPTSLPDNEMLFRTDIYGDQKSGDIANVPIAEPSVFMKKINHLDK